WENVTEEPRFGLFEPAYLTSIFTPCQESWARYAPDAVSCLPAVLDLIDLDLRIDGKILLLVTCALQVYAGHGEARGNAGQYQPGLRSRLIPKLGLDVS